MDLSQMSPNSTLCSSRLYLINPGLKYLVYLPVGGTVQVDLSTASDKFIASRFGPVTGETTSGGTVSGGGPILLTSPIAGDAVLYLQAIAPVSSLDSASPTILSSSDSNLITTTTSLRTAGLSLSNPGLDTVAPGSSVRPLFAQLWELSENIPLTFLWLDCRKEFLLLFCQTLAYPLLNTTERSRLQLPPWPEVIPNGGTFANSTNNHVTDKHFGSFDLLYD